MHTSKAKMLVLYLYAMRIHQKVLHQRMKLRFSFHKDCSDNLEDGLEGVRLEAETQIRDNSDSEMGDDQVRDEGGICGNKGEESKGEAEGVQM